MKEKSLELIQILSNRAQCLLKSPRHLYKEDGKIEQKEKFTWHFKTVETNNNFLDDKILTLSFGESSNILETLFKEAISQMSSGRTVHFLEKLSFRELENFLRDENHLPVFHQTDLLKAQEIAKVVKNSLLSELLEKKIDKKMAPPISWNDLSLVQKNLQSRSLIFAINSLFPQVKSIELALAEEDKVSIVMNDFPLSLEVLEGVLESHFLVSLTKTSLKMVAVQ